MGEWVPFVEPSAASRYEGCVGLLVTATLLFALLIAFGAVGLVRPPARERRAPAEVAPASAVGVPQDAAATGDATPGSGMRRLKDVLRARDWRRALPSLLIITGLLGVMLFGSLSLIYVLEQTAAGIASLGVLLFTIGRLAYDYARA